LISHSPISHWQVSHVAHALSCMGRGNGASSDDSMGMHKGHL
jgi:hypothetical protein